MSRITINDPLVGDLGVIADVNTTINSWNNQSGDIESENIRMEGLDRRNFVKTDRRGTDKTFQVFGDVDIADYASGLHSSYNTVAFGELGAARVHCGGFDVVSGDKIIVHAGFYFHDDRSGGGPYVAKGLRGTVGYKTGSGGAVTQLPNTRRYFGTSDTGTAASSYRMKGNYAVCTVPSLPVGTNYWFTLMIEVTGAGNPDIEIIEPYIMAVRLRA
jgi:hypothetical protein